VLPSWQHDTHFSCAFEAVDKEPPRGHCLINIGSRAHPPQSSCFWRTSGTEKLSAHGESQRSSRASDGPTAPGIPPVARGSSGRRETDKVRKDRRRFRRQVRHQRKDALRLAVHNDSGVPAFCHDDAYVPAPASPRVGSRRRGVWPRHRVRLRRSARRASKIPSKKDLQERHQACALEPSSDFGNEDDVLNERRPVPVESNERVRQRQQHHDVERRLPPLS